MRDKIYPHAVNAISVGKSPRYMTPKEADWGAVDRSYISVLVQGDRPIVPAAAPVMLVLSVSCRTAVEEGSTFSRVGSAVRALCRD